MARRIEPHFKKNFRGNLIFILPDSFHAQTFRKLLVGNCVERNEWDEIQRRVDEFVVRDRFLCVDEADHF